MYAQSPVVADIEIQASAHIPYRAGWRIYPDYRAGWPLGRVHKARVTELLTTAERRHLAAHGDTFFFTWMHIGQLARQLEQEITQARAL